MSKIDEHDWIDLIRSLEARVATYDAALRKIEGGYIPGMADLVIGNDWHEVVNRMQAIARDALGVK